MWAQHSSAYRQAPFSLREKQGGGRVGGRQRQGALVLFKQTSLQTLRRLPQVRALLILKNSMTGQSKHLPRPKWHFRSAKFARGGGCNPMTKFISSWPFTPLLKNIMNSALAKEALWIPSPSQVTSTKTTTRERVCPRPLPFGHEENPLSTVHYLVHKGYSRSSLPGVMEGSGLAETALSSNFRCTSGVWHWASLLKVTLSVLESLYRTIMMPVFWYEI